MAFAISDNRNSRGDARKMRDSTISIEDYDKVIISSDNWRVLAKVLACLLLVVVMVIVMKLAYKSGHDDSIHDIIKSGYEVTHVTNVNTNYYIVNKKIER